MQMVSRTVPGFLLACFLLVSAISSAQSVASNYTSVTDEMLLDPPPGDWPMWRRTYGHWGHSPLDQINTVNVSSLRLAWAWTMGEGRQETTPLVHDGVMFLVQACDFVEALDIRDSGSIGGNRLNTQLTLPAPTATAHSTRTSSSSPLTTLIWWP